MSELVEAKGQMLQSRESGNLRQFIQTVAMKIQHLYDRKQVNKIAILSGSTTGH